MRHNQIHGSVPEAIEYLGLRDLKIETNDDLNKCADMIARYGMCHGARGVAQFQRLRQDTLNDSLAKIFMRILKDKKAMNMVKDYFDAVVYEDTVYIGVDYDNDTDKANLRYILSMKMNILHH